MGWFWPIYAVHRVDRWKKMSGRKTHMSNRDWESEQIPKMKSDWHTWGIARTPVGFQGMKWEVLWGEVWGICAFGASLPQAKGKTLVLLSKWNPPQGFDQSSNITWLHVKRCSFPFEMGEGHRSGERYLGEHCRNSERENVGVRSRVHQRLWEAGHSHNLTVEPMWLLDRLRIWSARV